MAWENRIVLHMILAEKVRLCVMLGGKKKNNNFFISNNTTPDGTITKVFQGLMTLANELYENVSIDNTFTWMVIKMVPSL
jgi:hypothetical protein